MGPCTLAHNQENMLKTLLFDIENAPIKAYVWEKYVDGAVIDIMDEWYMICHASKWLDGKKVHWDALWNYKAYEKDPENDFHVTLSLRNMLHEADIVVAHNGDKFDIRKLNAKCIIHGIDPPSPYHSVDTLKLARKHFKFTSNRLDDLGRFLGVGRKVRTGGFDLWLDVMAGDPKAHKKMVRYNKQDVILLEEVYLKLRRWMNIPNVNPESEHPSCSRCGNTEYLKRDGFYYTRSGVGKYQQYRCECGGWARDRHNILSKEARAATLINL